MHKILATFVTFIGLTNQAWAFPEYTCLYKCPDDSSKQKCELSFVKANGKYHPIVSDPAMALAKMKDGRFLGGPWKNIIEDHNMLFFILDDYEYIGIDDNYKVAGVQTLTLIKGSGHFTLAFTGDHSSTRLNIQLEGMCTYQKE